MNYLNLKLILVKFFVALLIGFIALFVLYFKLYCYYNDLQKAENKIQLYNAILLTDKLYAKGGSDKIYDFLVQLGFEEVTDKQLKKNILIEDASLIDMQTNFGKVFGLVYDKNYYLKINNLKYDESKVFKNIQESSISILWIIILNIIICLIMIFISIYIYSLIKPLNGLKTHIFNSIQRKNSNFKYTKANEIGDIYKEFEKIIKKNNELTIARQFFLRSIMHELKTPIAKGQFAAAMPENEKNKIILSNVFKTLNSIIDEVKKIENVLSNENYLELKPYKYSYLLDKSIKSLLLEDESIIKTKISEDKTITTDEYLFTLVIKNLLDNAIKYSSDEKCEIEFFANMVEVRNYGEKTEFNEKEYFQAFVRGNSKKGGYGLGLYLIKYVCDTQGYVIEYEYSDKKHIFRIKFGTF